MLHRELVAMSFPLIGCKLFLCVCFKTFGIFNDSCNMSEFLALDVFQVLAEGGGLSGDVRSIVER